MTRFARPSGRCKQRCLTAFDPNLQQVLMLHVLFPGSETKKARRCL